MALRSLHPQMLRGLPLAFVAWLCLVCLLPAVADPRFPSLTGRVVDGASLLSAADEQELTKELQQLEDKSSDQLVVVTLPSLHGYSIEDFGYRLGRHWGIGTAELNNGVLLIVAPSERKVRIEVGYGLEPVLTDALSRVIIDNAILPRFRAGDLVGGIKNGVRDITAVLTGNAGEVEARAKVRRDADDPFVDWFILLFIAFSIWVIVSSVREHGLLWGIIYLFIGDGRSKGRGGSGGGGFSGGGGSFGGGGSSGSW